MDLYFNHLVNSELLDAAKSGDLEKIMAFIGDPQRFNAFRDAGGDINAVDLESTPSLSDK